MTLEIDDFLERARTIYDAQVDRIAPHFGINEEDIPRLKSVQILPFWEHVTELERDLAKVDSHFTGDQTRQVSDMLQKYRALIEEEKLYPTSGIRTRKDGSIILILEEHPEDYQLEAAIAHELGHIFLKKLALDREVSVGVTECYAYLTKFTKEFSRLYSQIQNSLDRAVSGEQLDVDEELPPKGLMYLCKVLAERGRNKEEIFRTAYNALVQEDGWLELTMVLSQTECEAGKRWLSATPPSEEEVKEFLDSSFYGGENPKGKHGEQRYIEVWGEPGHLIGGYLALELLTVPPEDSVPTLDYHMKVLQTAGDILYDKGANVSDSSAFLAEFKERLAARLD